ncbi:MAG: carbohydrate binding domain-containing protein [Brevinematales bacterium]|nr:carbohydrate binding domain-containing protein [Brevinematales bacterium]
MKNKNIVIFILSFLLINKIFSQTNIAIIGFANSGNKKENSFGLILTDSLYSFLSKIPDLKIINQEEINKKVKNLNLLQRKTINLQTAVDIGAEYGASHILIGDYIINRKIKQIKINIYLYKVSTMQVELKRSYTGSIGRDFFETVDKINVIIASLLTSKPIKSGKLIIETDADTYGDYELYINNTFEQKINKKENFNKNIVANIPITVMIKNLETKEFTYSNQIIVKNDETYRIVYKSKGGIIIKGLGHEGANIYINDNFYTKIPLLGEIELENIDTNKELTIYLKKGSDISKKRNITFSPGRYYILDFSSEVIGVKIDPLKLGKELVKNGNFSEDIITNGPNYLSLSYKIKQDLAGKWTLLCWDQGSGKCRKENNTLVIEILNPGQERWSVQLVQFPIPLKYGKSYLFSFEAKAEKPKKISVVVERVGGDWLFFSKELFFELTTDWEQYNKVFKSIGNDDFARLGFFLTFDKSAVYLRNVSIREIME